MIDKIKKGTKELIRTLAPFKDILWFLFLFVVFDFLWKLIVKEGIDEELLIILGKDFTNVVYPICKWTANVVFWVSHDLLGFTDLELNGILLHLPNSFTLKVVWGCTGIKQMILFAFIIILYFGPYKKKLIFLPVSLIILNLINIIRIVATIFIVKNGFPNWFIPFNEWYNNTIWVDTQTSYWDFYMDWFQLFHKDVFRWLYYDGVIFLLWLFWQEKINLPYQRNKKKKHTQEKILQ